VAPIALGSGDSAGIGPDPCLLAVTARLVARRSGVRA
jgi:hypothetical protein